MLNEKSQTEKNEYCMILLTCRIKKRKEKTSLQIQKTDGCLSETEVSKTGEKSQKVQTSSYEINK